jgi:hypothetical protein
MVTPLSSDSSQNDSILVSLLDGEFAFLPSTSVVRPWLSRTMMSCPQSHQNSMRVASHVLTALRRRPLEGELGRQLDALKVKHMASRQVPAAEATRRAKQWCPILATLTAPSSCSGRYPMCAAATAACVFSKTL